MNELFSTPWIKGLVLMIPVLGMLCYIGRQMLAQKVSVSIILPTLVVLSGVIKGGTWEVPIGASLEYQLVWVLVIIITFFALMMMCHQEPSDQPVGYGVAATAMLVAFGKSLGTMVGVLCGLMFLINWAEVRDFVEHYRQTHQTWKDVSLLLLFILVFYMTMRSSDPPKPQNGPI